MTSRSQVYGCKICGNIVDVLHVGKGTLVCCGEPMELFVENTRDASREKHVPVVPPTSDGFKVTVGETIHPMEEQHFIEWNELIADERVLRRFLEPGNKPEAEFCVTASQITARAYCNLHGFWKSV